MWLNKAPRSSWLAAKKMNIVSKYVIARLSQIVFLELCICLNLAIVWAANRYGQQSATAIVVTEVLLNSDSCDCDRGAGARPSAPDRPCPSLSHA